MMGAHFITDFIKPATRLTPRQRQQACNQVSREVAGCK